MSPTRPSWMDLTPWLPITREADEEAVRSTLGADAPGVTDLAVLLSPAASQFLEPMAQRAQALTRRHFGRTISLYVPLYISDHCSSGCTYCGFASDRKFPRRRLDRVELLAEMQSIEQMGFEEILLLTGERALDADFEYLRECVSAAAQRFHHVTVETFAMSEEEYATLVSAGCTGVTLYQETYDPVLYEKLHRWGHKKDYEGRLDAPGRALRAGMRTVGLGVLLGLADPVSDALRLFLHAEQMRKTYWKAGVSISFPRIRPQRGDYDAPYPVDDTFLAQMIFAFRICLPDVPLVLSTRESPQFRDGMAGVGISKMSIASKTTVGGYHEHADPDQGQFHISDTRDTGAFCSMLNAKGLQPVFKNWDAVYRS